MRLAVVVAPSDPKSGDAVARREALARLRGQLARTGFDVIIAGGGQDPASALEKAATRVSPGDSLLVHLSGRLLEGELLAFGGGRSLALREVAQALAARAPADLAFVAELMHDDAAAGPGVATAAAVALSRPWGDSASGASYSVLAAVRPLASGLPRLAFTERVLAARESGAPSPPPDALIAGMHERARADAETMAMAPWFAFAAAGESVSPGAGAVHELDEAEVASDRIERGEAEAEPMVVEPADLEPADLEPADLEPADLEPADLEPADLEPAEPGLPATPVLPPLPQSVESGTALAGSAPYASWLDSPSLIPPLVAPSAASIGSGDDALRAQDTAEVDAQIADATATEDWKLVLDLRLAKLAVLEDSGLQVKELIAMARLLQTHLADPEGAIKSLEQARELEPERASILRALRRGYETMGRWASAMEVIGVLAEMASGPAERAELRAAQATIAFDRLGDEGGAETWVRAALEDDASNEAALALHRRMHAAPDPEPIRAPEPSAIDLPIDDVEEDAPDASHIPGVWNAPAAGPDYGAHFGAAEVGAEAMSGLPTFAELEAAAERDPFNPTTYRQMHARYLQDGNTDAAYLAAMSLEELKAADLNQQGLVDHFRSVSPVRARASLDAAAWELLWAPGYDDVLAAIFVAVGRAAIEVRLEDLYEQRRASPPDRERRLGEASTASIVRGFQWAARFLGMTCPDLYVIEETSGCTVLPAITPSTALGPDVLSGQSAKDLAFLAGYHLARYRPEYRVLSFYPTREDLTMLLFAAAQLGMPAGPPGAAGSVGSLRTRLARQMIERERVALAAAVSRLDARGGQATIGAWMRSLELTAVRVGLLLCGDLATASALVASPLCVAQEPPLDARRGDAVAFCASPGHAELRARFITSAGSSVRSTDNLSSFSHGA
jgi:hypothetical protein